MHQPFYKDLVTGEYRLPWVRLHALKDYYGMVKLLEEFPDVHQTFNLVPSLIAQIQDYVAGTGRDPFLDVAAKPAADLTPDERRFALEYLFQANVTNLIGRYPRYQELYEKYRANGAVPARAEAYFSAQDFTDLQVLSQVAWFDEFFLDEPEVVALISKGRDFSKDDQRFVIATQKELLGRVLPAYAEAANRGRIEISTSPYYHPILPLLCDTDAGRASSPGLSLPSRRFQRPEDAREQLVRGLDLHEKVFGVRPRGAWPSEGSVSDAAMAIGHQVGLHWMATDEGVLGRSLGVNFARDGSGAMSPELAGKLYTPWRFEQGPTEMHLLFRDHSLSDLIGFVYSGMPAPEAANHLIKNIKKTAQPALDTGKDATVSIILDGENAWEYYPRSGREFLRLLYDRISRDPQLEAVTVSEAVARQKELPTLKALAPGSWINANFNVWIGAPEDNKAWDYLASARERFAQASASLPAAKRELAFEELLIAEGSDWNWWYGPEHHSANDRDFDELYRKHLSNVYQALGQPGPDYLAQPIAGEEARPYFAPQSAFIHPKVDGSSARYFEWMGAAMYTADRRSSAMHGKQFLLDAVYGGIDEQNLYGRIDFVLGVPRGSLDLKIHVEAGKQTFVLTAAVQERALTSWAIACVDGERETPLAPELAKEFDMAVARNAEFRISLKLLGADAGSRIGMRCTLWRDHLPIDAMPLEGLFELRVATEPDLAGNA
jgi:alpha-amylase/alpha-mannosidase (GH57 family)